MKPRTIAATSGRPTTFAALVVLVGFVACGDPAVPHPTPSTGTYNAVQVAGAPLPFIGENVQSGGTVCHEQVHSATLVLRPSGTFRLSLSGRFICDSGVNLPFGRTSNGEFATTGGRIEFHVLEHFGTATFRSDVVEFVPAAPGAYQPATFQLVARDTLP